MNFKKVAALALKYAASLLVITTLAALTYAQAPAKDKESTLPQPLPSPSPEKKFFKNILKDQRAIWTSPFHLKGEDAKWLVPLGVTTAALIATDRGSAGALHNDRLRLNISRDVSELGSIYGTGAIAATFYLVGRKTGNARARETGVLAGEAIINGWIVSKALKSVTERRRPRATKNSGDFFRGGFSFPSGHAITAWSVATVIANEYHDHRLVQVSAYGLATLVSASRFTGRNHFLSDVLVGSAIGYGIGRYIYRAHHDPALDSISQKMPHTHSKLLPFIMPTYQRSARSYGVGLLWTF
jgi:membrane-associated phospholipid phosphatase